MIAVVGPMGLVCPRIAYSLYNHNRRVVRPCLWGREGLYYGDAGRGRGAQPYHREGRVKQARVGQPQPLAVWDFDRPPTAVEPDVSGVLRALANATRLQVFRRLAAGYGGPGGIAGGPGGPRGAG